MGLLLTRIIRLYRLRLNDDRGVSALIVLALRCNRSGHVATRESERKSEAGQQRRHCRRHDFVDLLFTHSDMVLRLLFSFIVSAASRVLS